MNNMEKEENKYGNSLNPYDSHLDSLRSLKPISKTHKKKKKTSSTN